ncbi:MAG: ABC transporter ATP-binding protein [Negativicutes bacterium]|nr:ABC transporter ATP-binding protein [Negativicutes bacterium]
MSVPSVFELSGVSYQYRPCEPALRDINLNIMAGERIVLLGPNGCGKSTLEKVLAGLIFPGGRVTAFGAEIDAAGMRDKEFAAAFRRKVGFVFQNSDVQIFCASVLDEIMFGPLAMGMPYAAARDRALELAEFVGINALIDRLPHHLSGGEKKKVAIAAVLAVNPAVLILDEPTNGLDPRTQRWMLDTLSHLNHAGKTIIIATHQLDIVRELAGRVVVMDDSHTVVAEGEADDILQNRQLLLAANLIDERYHVHLHGEDGHVHVHKHGHDDSE